jgi:RNAse (barnase) inhibitor barstar
MKPMAKQLLSAEQGGVYQLVRKPEEVEHAAKEAGLAVFRIDIANAQDKQDFLSRVAKALSFPDWFGGNWDALNDCLRDLEWLPSKTGYVLILENIEPFGAVNKQEYEKAKAVLLSAADYWKSEGRPFWAFIAASHGWDSGLPRWPSPT